MRENTTLKTACLTVGLATAWLPQSAHAVDHSTVNINLNFNASSLNNAYLAFTVNGSGYARFGPFNFNGSDNFDFNTPFFPADFNSYVLVGSYAAGAVAVSINDASFGEGRAFETAFPSFNEFVVDSWLATNDTANIDTFLGSALSRFEVREFVNFPSNMIAFSDGVVAGDVTVSVSEIPEPTTAAALGLIFVLAARRR